MSDPIAVIAREHSDRSNLMFLPTRTDAHPHEASLRAQRSNLIRRVIPTQSEANGKRRSDKRSSIAAGQARTGNLETKVIQPWGLLLVTGLALVIAVVTFDPQLDPEVDSADYIVLGKSLRAGLGMRYIHLPEAPKLHKFPVGFPLLLAGVEWAAPDSLVARKVLVAACYVGAVALFFRLASTYVTPLTAFLVTVLTALNPFVLGMARIVMSEIPYLLCSLVALSILERALDSPDPPPRWAWVGGVLALLFAAQVRTIGWSLLLALVVVLLLRPDVGRGRDTDRTTVPRGGGADREPLPRGLGGAYDCLPRGDRSWRGSSGSASSRSVDSEIHPACDPRDVPPDPAWARFFNGLQVSARRSA